MQKARSQTNCCSLAISMRGSLPHDLAVAAPEGAHRHLGHPVVLAWADIPAAHLENRRFLRIAARAFLHPADDHAVLHGDEARGADEVALLDAKGLLFRRVVL